MGDLVKITLSDAEVALRQVKLLALIDEIDSTAAEQKASAAEFRAKVKELNVTLRTTKREIRERAIWRDAQLDIPGTERPASAPPASTIDPTAEGARAAAAHAQDEAAQKVRATPVAEKPLLALPAPSGAPTTDGAPQWPYLPAVVFSISREAYAEHRDVLHDPLSDDFGATCWGDGEDESRKVTDPFDGEKGPAALRARLGILGIEAIETPIAAPVPSQSLVIFVVGTDAWYDLAAEDKERLRNPKPLGRKRRSGEADQVEWGAGRWPSGVGDLNPEFISSEPIERAGDAAEAIRATARAAGVELTEHASPMWTCPRCSVQVGPGSFRVHGGLETGGVCWSCGDEIADAQHQRRVEAEKAEKAAQKKSRRAKKAPAATESQAQSYAPEDPRTIALSLAEYDRVVELPGAADLMLWLGDVECIWDDATGHMESEPFNPEQLVRVHEFLLEHCAGWVEMGPDGAVLFIGGAGLAAPAGRKKASKKRGQKPAAEVSP